MPVRPRHSARALRPGFWRQWTLWLYFPLAMLLILGGVCVWKSGKWLVVEDAFEKASWSVVLAGESRDVERSDAALKLYLDGRIDTLVYSSTRVFKDRYASEFMVDYLSKEGYPRDKLFEFRQDTYSTLEEARQLVRQFRWQNLDTVLIITSNFHTARTRRIFRRLAQGYPHILVYPAEYNDYDPSAWWSSREGRKHWLLEWTKSVATWFEMAGMPPETGKAETNGLFGGYSGAQAIKNLPFTSSPNPSQSPAPRDSAADSLAAAKDTSAAGPSSPKLDGDSAKTSSSSDSAAKASDKDGAEKDPPSKEAAAATPKETTAKKETKGTTKDTAASKAAPSKTTAKSTTAKAEATTTSKSVAKKASEKEKAKRKTRAP